ncbi:hypothetical protein A2U01_0081743, partial [Trifolium medium]|nr:hypothetical protein [Trifolium medium]
MAEARSACKQALRLAQPALRLAQLADSIQDFLTSCYRDFKAHSTLNQYSST